MRKTKKKDNKSNQSSPKQVFNGVVDVTRSGMAFIVIDGKDQDVKVYPENLNSALDGDTVQIEILKRAKATGRQEGKVIRVLKRRHTSFSGTIAMNKGFAFLVTADEELPDIFVTQDNLNGAKDGDKAVVEITDWGNEKRNPAGKITVLLDRNEIGRAHV